eukprot:gene6431-4635_t
MADFDCLINNDLDGVRRQFTPSNVNKVNKEGTPLYYACMKTCVNVNTIAELLKIGAGVDVKGDDGETPLFIASFQNREDVVQLLLSNGADVNATSTGRKDTALHAASRLGYEGLIQLLLKKGANVNARNAKQETPCFCAAKHGRHRAVYYLMVGGANLKLTNEDGKDPLFIASEREYKNVILVLKAKKDELKHAKAAGDAELRAATNRISTSEEIVAKMNSDKASQAKARSQKSAAASPGEKKNESKKMEIIEIHVPKPKARTHDPFSGAALGPCKTLEEVGYDEPPPIPKELQNRPPCVPTRIGGTQMVVETEHGSVVPVKVDDILGDEQTSFYLPSKNR